MLGTPGQGPGQRVLSRQELLPAALGRSARSGELGHELAAPSGCTGARCGPVVTGQGTMVLN